MGPRAYLVGTDKTDLEEWKKLVDGVAFKYIKVDAIGIWEFDRRLERPVPWRDVSRFEQLWGLLRW